jgi:hypothetical protein
MAHLFERIKKSSVIDDIKNGKTQEKICQKSLSELLDYLEPNIFNVKYVSVMIETTMDSTKTLDFVFNIKAFPFMFRCRFSLAKDYEEFKTKWINHVKTDIDLLYHFHESINTKNYNNVVTIFLNIHNRYGDILNTYQTAKPFFEWLVSTMDIKLINCISCCWDYSLTGINKKCAVMASRYRLSMAFSRSKFFKKCKKDLSLAASSIPLELYQFADKYGEELPGYELVEKTIIDVVSEIMSPDIAKIVYGYIL